MVRHTSCALLVMAMTFGAVGVPTIASASTSVAQAAAEQQFAVVRLTIEQADGKVLRATQTVPWGEAATFELGEDQRHELSITVQEHHALSVDYARNGQAVLDDASVVAAGRSSSVVHQDAEATVSVRVIRTTARVESRPM